MRKLLAILLTGALLLTGCGNKNNQNDTKVKEKEVANTENEFYNKYQNAKKRPVAVMIDNDGTSSRPHAGLSEAYLLYEMYVEGSATRIMALFNETDTAKIGPVRSSRHYFLDYAMEHDALYVHFGWSPKAMEDIPALGVNNINGVLGNDGDCFWREEKYKGDYHSAFTSMERINKKVGQHKYRTDREKAPLLFNDSVLDIKGDNAEKISFAYAGFYRVGFEYDEKSKTYKRYINGAEHPLYDTEKLAVQNIIFMNVRSYDLGDGSPRQQFDTVGTGNGYFITCGKYIPITWEKTARGAATVYKDKDGEQIKLNPGQTWIMLIPQNANPEIK